METMVFEMVAQWGIFGILVIFAIWIIVGHVKEFFENRNKKDKTENNHHDDNSSSIDLLTTLITTISHKIDKVDDRMIVLEDKLNSASNRLTAVEVRLSSQPKDFIERIDQFHKEKAAIHNKMMEDQMRLGPELHNILGKYKEKMKAHHIFLGSFHNGTTNISGIPYCKFDLIAEKFSPDDVKRDIEYAFIYKDSDIIRHNKLPMLLLDENMVHFVINPDKTSKLSEIDDIIYRRMIGRDIKQLAIHITRDEDGLPSGFVGGTRYDYDDMELYELKACAKELEIIYRNSK